MKTLMRRQNEFTEESATHENERINGISRIRKCIIACTSLCFASHFLSCILLFSHSETHNYFYKGIELS